MNEIARRDKRMQVGARRFGYLVAIAINLVMLYLIYGWPGWAAVPFLTDATVDVLGLVSASIIASAVVNLVYLVRDPPSIRAIGQLITTAIGLAAAVRIWQVFPFDFSGYSFDWATVARVLLVVAIVGSIIGLIANVVALLRALA